MSGPRIVLGPPGGRVVSLVLLLVAVFAAVGLSIGYTAMSVHRSDRQWCELLRGIDQPLPSSTPVTERARQFAAEVHKLRAAKGC